METVQWTVSPVQKQNMGSHCFAPTKANRIKKMLKIKIITIGKIKESSIKEMLSEYQKRLGRYCDISIIELDDEKELSDNNKDIEKVVNIESEKILKQFEKNNDYKILLDINGKELNSIEFAEKIANINNDLNKNIVFVIGGSNGVNDEVRKAVDFRLSFSKLTFPHQLFRVILVEQIYRCFKIINGEKYHK